MMLTDVKIAIVGLGYVGLPLAVELGKHKPIIAFDVEQARIDELRSGVDSTNEVVQEDLQRANLELTTNPADLRKANFIIVAVPTPIDNVKKPDLAAIKKSAELVGKNLSPGTVVVYESTVYPGVTEDVCVPLLQEFSGLRCGTDFKIGYSPERVNPGDKVHTIDKVVKVVSGQDTETLNIVAQVYSLICTQGVHKAPSIKVAEAAKVIENVQRDLNIALVNELSLIFNRLGINTGDVLEAAGTKWNFHHYQPGLVGGHCIGVDPYYLTYIAEQLGYNPQIILAGRRINDYMAEHVADLIIKGLIEAGKPVQNAKVLILGLTFKENVNDVRNSKVKDVVKKLKEYKIQVLAHDPLLSAGTVNDFGADNVDDLQNLPQVDAVALCVAHDQFKNFSIYDLQGLMRGRPVLVDVKELFREKIASWPDLIYKSL